MLPNNPNIYIFLSEYCEQYSFESRRTKIIWNRELISKFIFELPALQLGKIWIRIPGILLSDNSFINILERLSYVCDNKRIPSITIQCNAEEMIVKSRETTFKKYSISLIVCDHPRCSIRMPTHIISNSLLAKKTFKSFSLVSPSPVECIFGINTGTRIRHCCLAKRDLYFIMSNYSVQICPLGILPEIGNFRFDSLSNILKLSKNTSFPNPQIPFENSDDININICEVCLGKLPDY